MSSGLGKKKKMDSRGFFERLFKGKSSSSKRDSDVSKTLTASDSLDKTRPCAGEGPAITRSTTDSVRDKCQANTSKPASGGQTSVSGRLGRKARDPDGASPSSSAASHHPVRFPATPETLLASHCARPFLDGEEQAVLEELNEYECLVDGFDVVRAAAQHVRYFGTEPAQIWDEFFRFVDEVAGYDNVINAEIWREFTDRKYPC